MIIPHFYELRLSRNRTGHEETPATIQKKLHRESPHEVLQGHSNSSWKKPLCPLLFCLRLCSMCDSSMQLWHDKSSMSFSVPTSKCSSSQPELQHLMFNYRHYSATCFFTDNNFIAKDERRFKLTSRILCRNICCHEENKPLTLKLQCCHPMPRSKG